MNARDKEDTSQGEGKRNSSRMVSISFFLFLSFVASLRLIYTSSTASTSGYSSANEEEQIFPTTRKQKDAVHNNNNNTTTSGQTDVDPSIETPPPPSSSLSSKFLLSVPFYVYEDLLYWLEDDDDNGNNDNNDNSIVEKKSNTTMDGIPIKDFVESHAKHSNDYWFGVAAAKHPLRTHDPSKAKLFVIPLLMNMYDHRSFNPKASLCATVDVVKKTTTDTQQQQQQHQRQRLCDMDLLSHATKIILDDNDNINNSSSWFQKYPERHIVTTSHFAATKSWWNKGSKPKRLKEILKLSNAICFENRKCNDKNRWHAPSYLVGNPCQQQEKEHQQHPNDDDSKNNNNNHHNINNNNNKIYDATMIATLNSKHEPNQPKFQDRRNICQWLEEYNNSTTTTTTTTTTTNNSNNKLKIPICGRGDQCPALAQAKLGFHARGDTFGSQRLMDTLLSGTVPIFTRKEQYECQPKWIDWSQISYFVDVTEFENEKGDAFGSRISEIVQDDETFQEKLRAVLDNRYLFDWRNSLHPFDTYMYMLQAELYPETRIAESTWSAIKLPSPPK